jgi:hypothetical protein
MNPKHYKYLALSFTIPAISVASLLLNPSTAHALTPSTLGRAITRFIMNPSLAAGIVVAIVGILLIVRASLK